MKAVVNTIYGEPEVLEIRELPKPVPKDHEVLIKIQAATVNRTDCGFLRGKPWIARLFSGLLKPKYSSLGCEFAGEIEAIGASVTLYKPGDRVFGFNDQQFGAHAEYKLTAETDSMAIIPDLFSYEEAAPLTEGSHYALCNIRAAKVKSGQNVLINGATGAIGSAAVQLVKYFGASVTAVCHTRHVDLIKSLGANLVIDYTKEDFTRINDRFDFVFDSVGKSSFGKCKRLLKNKGIYISTELGYMWQNPVLGLLSPFFRNKKLLFPLPTINATDVAFLKELAEAGHFKPLIDRYYPLEQIADAYKYVLTGQKVGNVVITFQ